jgi:hypothetical protein
MFGRNIEQLRNHPFDEHVFGGAVEFPRGPVMIFQNRFHEGTMRKLLAGTVFGFAALFSSAAIAGPAVSTEWVESKVTLEQCKERVERAIRAAGIRDVDPKRYTVFAHAGDYTLAVRCMPDQGVVFFIASGARLAEADKYLDEVIAAYRR